MDDTTIDPNDDNLMPSEDRKPLSLEQEPGRTDVDFPVPEDEARAGNDTAIPGDDSPESLDEELSQGANREDIDSQHSIIRPEGVDTLDKEEYGAD